MSTEYYLMDGSRFARRNWCGEENGPRLTMEITRKQFRELPRATLICHGDPSHGSDVLTTRLCDFMDDQLLYGCEILWETAWHMEEERG